MKQLISLDRSVIPACDVPTLEKLSQLVSATYAVPGVGAYKVGLELVIPFGLARVVRTVRQHTDLPVIYDHQKGGTDIPELGPKFAKQVAACGANAAILFPFGGAATQREWTKACQGEGLIVLVGGHMTQKEFLASEGGYIVDGIRNDGPRRIYELAAELGVRDFVVPGNKPHLVWQYQCLLTGSHGGAPEGEKRFRLYAPGFISQGGDITEAGKAVGPITSWHAIVGSALYKQEGVEAIRAAAQKLTAQIAAAEGR